MRSSVSVNSENSAADKIHGPILAGGLAGSASKKAPFDKTCAAATCVPVTSARAHPEADGLCGSALVEAFRYCCDAGIVTLDGAEPRVSPIAVKPRSAT